MCPPTFLDPRNLAGMRRYLSFDRIHPDKGYTQDNVRIISNRANRLKCDGNVRELALIAADAMDIESIWPDLASEIRKRVQNF